MNGADMVQAAVLGLLAAIGVMCVALGILSRLGLLDHAGWVFRDERRRPMVTDVQRTEAVARVTATREWFDVDELVCDANWGAWESGPTVIPPHEMPTASPDPRRKEN